MIWTIPKWNGESYKFLYGIGNVKTRKIAVYFDSLEDAEKFVENCSAKTLARLGYKK